MHLYEAHLPVADTEAAQRFYVEIAGLQFAHRDLTRDTIFLWAGTDRRSMLGLWGPSMTLAISDPERAIERAILDRFTDVLG
jgi:catechol 2,3-dioxygenase-like lactoylglutathione lyase family enzyme